MKDLMIHVERIVRPVRAFAPRKLRMRRELLGHLEQALEEERSQNPDESKAIERAKGRLGEPAELARQLQQAVPLVERLLMARVPISQKLERWEERAGTRIYGQSGPMTMGHKAALAFLAGAITGPPWYTPKVVRDVMTQTGSPAHVTLFFMGVMLGLWAMLAASFRMVMAAADPARPLWRRGVIAPAAILLVLQLAYWFFAAQAGADRLPTVKDVAVGMTINLALLACSLLLARRVAHLRQRYDEWLTLDLA